LPFSTVAAWSAADIVHAATSIADDVEACPACGLRPDQYPFVEADTGHCPGCEAKQRVAKDIDPKSFGTFASFYPADDGRNSVWARFTRSGKQWARTHRRHPDPVFPNQDDVDG